MDEPNTHDWVVDCEDCDWHGMLSDARDRQRCPVCGSGEIVSEAFRLYLSLIERTMYTRQSGER